MAKNCLVTILKGTVDNDRFRKLGEMRLNVHNTNSDAMYLRVNMPNAVINDFVVDNPNVTLVAVSSPSQTYRDIKLGVGEYTLKLFGKYDYTGLNLTRDTNGNAFDLYGPNYVIADTNELDYSSITRYSQILFNGDIAKLGKVNYLHLSYYGLRNPYMVGDITSILSPNTTYVMLHDSADTVEGNISAFAACTNMTTIKMSCAGANTKLVGNISSLSPLVNLTGDLAFKGTSITGSIESLVEGQVTNNRQSGTFGFYWSENFTINNNSGTNIWTVISFDATGATIKNRTSQAVIATYSKSTGTWTYA